MTRDLTAPSKLRGFMAYYDNERSEIFPHLPDNCERLLDIGCGYGRVAQGVAREKAVGWTGGVELIPEAAAEAATHMDRVWTGAIEDADLEAEIPAGSLNVILCLDVLEHLVDPWAVVQRLSPLLAPGGRLIVSVPNIRHWRFIRNLFLKGDFHYTDAGLLDRTHLRFFVRQTAEELTVAGGLSLVGSYDTRTYDERAFDMRRLLIKATGGWMADLTAKQWIIVAESRA